MLRDLVSDTSLKRPGAVKKLNEYMTLGNYSGYCSNLVAQGVAKGIQQYVDVMKKISNFKEINFHKEFSSTTIKAPLVEGAAFHNNADCLKLLKKHISEQRKRTKRYNDAEARGDIKEGFDDKVERLGINNLEYAAPDDSSFINFMLNKKRYMNSYFWSFDDEEFRRRYINEMCAEVKFKEDKRRALCLLIDSITR